MSEKRRGREEVEEKIMEDSSFYKEVPEYFNFKPTTQPNLRVGGLELANFLCWHFFFSSSLDTQQLGNRHMEAALLATGNMAGEDPWQVEDLQHQSFLVHGIPTTAILSWLWSYC